MSFMKDLQKVLRENVREYGMFIALFIIMAIFTILTKGMFISSRNVSNLINQSGYIAVLAVGMTMVIVIRQIDLSVGFLAGFLGAIAAIGLHHDMWNLPVYVVLPLVLLLGVLAGLIIGFLVAQVKIPAFVATLAGWLIYRGAILVVTAKTGTIIIADETFNAIGNGFIPDIPGLKLFPGVHTLTLILGLLIMVAFVISQIGDRRKKQAYGFEVLPITFFILKLVFMVALIGSITWVLSGYNGLSWTVVIVLAVVAIYHFVTTKTVIGRHMYALGGNPEAALLSGINVKRVIYVVFGVMGLLSALSGILYASRLRSATLTAGSLFELDAIAAAFVGGVSPSGGIGKVTGSLIGALVMISLTSGMNLMGIGMDYQYIVRGAVLAIAVIFDVVVTRRSRE